MFVFPRLSAPDALALADRLISGEKLVPATSHERAVPHDVGTPAPESHLDEIRTTLKSATSKWTRRDVKRSEAAEWDRTVGRVLHETMRIIPSDAGHVGTWSFLTLVLLPDLAKRRFPQSAVSRLVGTPRNTFRRCWWRHHVLGDLETPDGAPALGEDELVNIFERSRMARDHRLARALASSIMEYEQPDRSEFARVLTRNVRVHTGVVLLDAMSDDQIDNLVRTEFNRAVEKRTSAGSPERKARRAPKDPSTTKARERTRKSKKKKQK